MKILLTIARGVRRVFAGLVHSARRDAGSEIVEEFTLAIPGGGVVRFQVTAAYRAAELAQATDAAQVAGDPDPVVDGMREFHLAVFRKTFSRYTRPELAQTGADVAHIPDAAEAVAERFAGWEDDRASRAAQALNADAQRSEFAAAVAASTTHALALIPLILHRAALHILRPVTPRAPAAPRLG